MYLSYSSLEILFSFDTVRIFPLKISNCTTEQWNRIKPLVVERDRFPLDRRWFSGPRFDSIAITTRSSYAKNYVRWIETVVHFYRSIHLGGYVAKGTQLARILKAIAQSRVITDRQYIAQSHLPILCNPHSCAKRIIVPFSFSELFSVFNVRYRAKFLCGRAS